MSPKSNKVDFAGPCTPPKLEGVFLSNIPNACYKKKNTKTTRIKTKLHNTSNKKSFEHANAVRSVLDLHNIAEDVITCIIII